METLFSSISIIANWQVMAALVAGSIGGVIIGAMPGVGPAMAIAILLPATFSMEPIVGLTLLMGVYGAAMFGGAIPAILMNVPGTAVNALTTYDGYPMTQKGQAGRALSLAYGASFVGGVFSIVCLMLFSPGLAEIAPLFGSREIFMAALLGAVLVVVAHPGQALLSGLLFFFGMFLASVGLENFQMSQRYTFDQPWLSSGFDMIVVILGLFALSQAFYLLMSKDKSLESLETPKNLRSGLWEVFRLPKASIISSCFGVVMGVVPGVGQFIAQFFAYTVIQGTSKKPETFGAGAPEGIIASEAANNAVPASAMIPLLALGIPGEAVTAMMLAVFYVHNVVPGPQLFVEEFDFVLALYLCLLLANVITLLFLLVSTGVVVKIAKIPNRYLGMLTLTMSFIGVYTLRNSFTDCIIASVFGFIGLILKRMELPTTPIVLGMVLGPIMEAKFRTSMARVETPLDFINRPISGTIFGIIVLCIVAQIFLKVRAARRQKAAQA
ncbi:tripartite tricarboxylate transporter permease [Lentibacter algarum]|uniref:tripartite tricarboxylate transporter permease n=1 Tax=Lentibacter algarum TaxID=576131 RepID=UPI001C08280B|nr:tripartite tricarboxylate transporter permease [Lentibacter algarum]MBU2983703.1 tripartite tricarboxylate transporter permease [Lentibacter algarum]